MPLDSIASHRRSVGRYNAVQKEPTQKTIIKAIKKARNSQETPRTQRANSSSARNGSNTLMTVVKIALVASVVAATIPSVQAITNGVSRNNNVNAKNTFPQIETRLRGDRPGKYNLCSSTRISANQVLTAAHCLVNQAKSTTSAKHTPTERTNAKTRVQRGDVDLSLMTFHRTLTGSTFCVPIMTNETYEMLLRSPPNICGLTGRLLMVGHGQSEVKGTARAGVFEPVAPHPSFKRYAHKSTVMVGTPFNPNAPYAYAGQGDSGAGVLGCNPATGQYELVGVFAQFADLRYKNHPNVKASIFVNLVEHQELSTWVANHRDTCTGPNLRPEDIYDPSVRGLGERHQVDRCKLPHRYYQKVGMDHDEICNCFEQKGTIAPREFKCTDEPTTMAPTTIPPTTIPPTTIPPTTAAPIQPIQNDFIFPDCLDDLIVPTNKKETTLHYVSNECSDPMSLQIKPYCRTSNNDQMNITMPARGNNAYRRIFTKSEELEPDCKNPFTDGTVRLLHDYTLPDCLPDYSYSPNEDGITMHYILGNCDVPTPLLIKSYCRVPGSEQAEITLPAAAVDSVAHFATLSEASHADCKNPFTDGRFKDEVRPTTAKPTTKPFIARPKKPVAGENVVDCIGVQLTENNGLTKVDLQNTCDHDVGIAMTFGNREVTTLLSLQSGKNNSISMSMPLIKNSVYTAADGIHFKPVPKFFENKGLSKDEARLTTAKPTTESTIEPAIEPTTKPLIILPKKPVAADYDVDCIEAQLTENKGQITVDLQNTCDQDVRIAMTFGNQEVTTLLSLQHGQNNSISMSMPLNKKSVHISTDGKTYKSAPKFFENRARKDEPRLKTVKPTTKPLITLPKKPVARDNDVDCLGAQVTEDRHGQITVDLQNTCDHDVGIAMTFGNQEVTNMLSLQSGHNSSISMYMPLVKDSVRIAEDGKKYKPVPNFFKNRGIK